MFGLFKKNVDKFTGHFLDPNRGYYTSTITPASEDDRRKLSERADDGNLYFIIHYENGQPVEALLSPDKKSIWLDLKRTLGELSGTDI